MVRDEPNRIMQQRLKGQPLGVYVICSQARGTQV
jgi:hypothetical protein